MLSAIEYKHIKTERITGHLSKGKLPGNFVSIWVYEDEILVHLCCPEAQEVFALQNRDKAELSSCMNIQFP